MPLPYLLTPIVVMTVAGMAADVVGPGLINERPLLQMALNPRNRYLLLASPQVGAVEFYVVGFVRLVLTDPLFYVLGLQYGDRALRWAERKMADDVGFVRSVERWFSKAAPVVIVVAPSGYMCLLAGATGMRPRVFVALNAVGTAGRLVLFRFVGDALSDQIFTVLDLIQRYQWWLIAISFVIVALQARRRRSSGAIESVSRMEAEIESAGPTLEVRSGEEPGT
ncbi:MAG: DedA family protein [Acidimicrobiales bacterium]